MSSNSAIHNDEAIRKLGSEGFDCGQSCLSFLQRALSLGFQTIFFQSVPPLFWTLFYCWCLNELNSRSMLKHCIFGNYLPPLHEISSCLQSLRSQKNLKKAHLSYVPRFPLNFTNSTKTVKQAIGPGNPRAAAWQ